MAGLIPWIRTKDQLRASDSPVKDAPRTKGESDTNDPRPNTAVISTDDAVMNKNNDKPAPTPGAHAEPQPTLDATPSTDLEVYATRVEIARLNRSPDVILNSSHGHAAVLIEKLFQAADKQIHVLCKELNPPVYGKDDVVAAARDFLQRDGARLRILVQDHAALSDAARERNAFLREFWDHPSVSIRPAPETSAPFNFFVVDTDGFRFEPDKDEPVARASFNNPLLCFSLREYFKLLEASVQGHA